MKTSEKGVPGCDSTNDTRTSIDPGRRNLAMSMLAALGAGGLLKGCTWEDDLSADTRSIDEVPSISNTQLALNGTNNIRWFDTVASMRAFAVGANTNYTAIVHGYATPGDGGGGLFVWSTTAQKDDGKTGTALYSGTIVNPLVSGNINPTPAAGWRRIYAGAVDVRWFGAKGDNITDDTAVLSHVFSSPHNSFDLAGLNYRIALPYGSFLGKWSAPRSGIVINGNGATIYDTTNHSSTPIGNFTSVLWFEGCSNIRVIDLNYIGTPVGNLSTMLGKNGVIVVRCTAGTSDVAYQGRVSHAAYGLQTGEYGSPSQGGCRNIRATLETYCCGYPWASHLCDDIDVTISADTTHRAAYVAGTNGGRVVARFKNQYGAPIQVLVTDSLSSGMEESVGTSNLYVEAIDLGSTVTWPNSWCCGISASRLHVTKFSNLHFKFGVKSDDHKSKDMGGWGIFNSGASLWHPSSVIRNIVVEGTIDRTEQTVPGNINGEILAYPCNDDGSFPVVENIVMRNVVIRRGASPIANALFQMPGLTKIGLHFQCCDLRDCGATFHTPPSSIVRFSGCALSTILDGASTGPFEFINCTMSGALPSSIAFQSKTDGLSSLSTTRSLITASSVQVQGQCPLSARYNDITICAHPNDTVTLPPADPALGQIWVINYGAQILKIFPASGDSLGSGTDIPVTLVSTAAASWVAVNTLQWRRLV